MSFTNINDPAGVKALLDRLRASQAWQSLVNTPPTPDQPPAPQPVPSGSDPSPGSASSVAALLSQLNSAPAVTQPVESSYAPHQIQKLPPSPSKDPLPAPSPSGSASYAITEDIRSLTFQQALPRLAQLSDDPAVVSMMAKLKQEQDKLERELWQERTAIRTKYEEKVKVAKVKATLIGTGLSKHEGDMLVQAYERELRRFDSERVLPAWDGLVTSQQAALAQLKIPTIYPTTVKADRERQQRVIQVLEGIMGTAA
ncbi:hypothetical protein B0H19DRAFT_1176364 [Mycena capillaripes]|nr:hypothetical protein B0H19DRAFT_1176364 [Mycena capillaripes]